jgi:hypothetical protein
VLLTWKADGGLLPKGFIIEKSETKGGILELTNRTDSAGNVVASNLMVTDASGRPQRTYEEVIEPDVGSISASIAGQYAYLDEDFLADDMGKAYYYRIRGKFLDVPGDIVVPDMNLSIPFLRAVNGFLLMLKDLLSGRGDPSEEVGVYLPNPGEMGTMYNMTLESDERSERSWLAEWGGNGGWSRVSMVTLFRPLLQVIEELRNFVEALLASIESGVAEIVAFIELLQTKITALNTFIEILQAIIAMLDAIALVEFGCLFVTTDNGTAGVLSAINDTALPGVPGAGEADYVGSVTILGGTAGAGGALNALQVLFGLS